MKYKKLHTIELTSDFARRQSLWRSPLIPHMNISHSFYFILFLGICLSSCKDPEPDPGPDGDLAALRMTVNTNIGNNLIIPAYEALLTKVNSLETTTADFIQEPDITKLQAVQDALKSAWISWQDASLYLLGPGESAGLRSALATYPTSDSKIETNIGAGNYILGSIDNQSAVGFPALDYLLHGQAEDQAGILTAFTTASDAAQRLQYLTDLVVHIKDKVQNTHDGWIASSGNYIAEFTSETASGTDAGSSFGLLLNAIDLHFQRFLRDGKIAIPAGIRSAGVPRPKTVEALYGGYSVELLVAALQAYERLFLGITASGEDKEGLYDYLLLLEESELAEDLKSQWSSTINTAKALNDPLPDQIDTDLDAVTHVFLEMQKIVVFIKADMASVMGITITNQDNDGD